MKNLVLEYFKGDELATSAWIDKYKMENEKTPDDMHKRLAIEFSKVEDAYKEKQPEMTTGLFNSLSDYGKTRPRLTEDRIYEMFKDFKYIIPQGSVMSQLGNNESFGSISNCVVIDSPEDSYAGIMEADSQLAHLMKRRCGVGLDISTLRPSGSKVSNSAKSSTGAVSFMNRFSETTREVAQGGRRGALMLTMDVNHPDILDFIKSKRDLTKITGANISIKVNDEFMRAVENDEDYILSFPVDKYIDYNLHSDQPFNQTIRCSDSEGDYYVKRVNAKEIYDEFIKSNWMSAEPAFLFWDRVQEYSPDGVYENYKQISTNPCSEIAMQPFDTCRLMVLNMTSFVDNPYTENAKFDFKKFREYAYEQQRLADDLIDLEVEKIDRILDKLREENNVKNKLEIDLWNNLKTTALNGRRTGCGFTGLGDTIAMLGYAYDSDESLSFVNEAMFNKFKGELDCTIDLSILRGSFKEWDNKLENNSFYAFIKTNFEEEWSRMCKFGRRNISWSTVAPTGTVSLMAQTTSGIEPLFMPYYIRRKKINPNQTNKIDFVDDNGDSWTEYPVVHKGLSDWINIQAKGKYSVSELDRGDLEGFFKESPYYGSTAESIDWLKRVELQSIVQKYTTHSISSTINLPNEVSEKEIADIYLHSWKQGLKGITVYRDGCRSGVLISDSSVTKNNNDFSDVDAVKRPKELDMDLFHTTAKGERFTIIVGLMENRPYEIFAVRGEIGRHGVSGRIKKLTGGKYDISQNEELIENITQGMTGAEIALTRLVSMGLRHRVNVKYIVEQLNKSEDFIVSFSKAIARTLKKYIPEGETSSVKCQNPDCTGDRTNVIFEEGCSRCLDCGSSKCG